MNKTASLVCAAVFLLGACSNAQKAVEVEPEFVSSQKYTSMSCHKLREEAERVKASVSGLETSVDKAYKDDKTMEAVTWILFWPAVFAMDGNDEEAAKLSKAKGEAQAITAAMQSKRCRMN